MKLRPWLTFLRIHTSNLTQVGALLGPLLAGVRNIPFLFLYVLWGLCYHAWGFTDNNLQDYEYDRKDPAKQHFALIKGTIPIGKAKLVNLLLFIPTLLLGLALTYPIIEHPTAFAFLILCIISGMMYNRTCKKSLLAPIYIAIAFTSLPLFTFFTISSTFNPAIIMVGAYTIFLMLFQIAFEGYLKDIETDPVNLLRTFGAYVRNNKLQLGFQKSFWLFVKIINVFIGLYFILVINIDSADSAATFLLYAFLVVLMIGIYDKLVQENYNNKKITSNASRMEILTYFALIVSLQSILGWETVAILLIYPIVWFLVLNYATWQTLLRPKV